MRSVVPPARVCVIAAVAALGLVFSIRELLAQADFRVDTNLVVLQVTVADRQGRLAGDLSAPAFQVYENGSPQKLTLFRHEDTAVAVGLVVDNSGSMRRKLPDVVAAADVFARSSNPEDQMFVVNFNEHVSLGLPPGEPFVSNPEKLKAAMLRIQANGETALFDAVAAALDHIRGSTLQKKVLIVISDGGDNASKHRFHDVLSSIEHSDVVVFTTGLFDDYDKDRNPGVLKQFAETSGGEAFFPQEIPDVTKVLEKISREIRNQYTIGYSPADGRQDGTYRSVRVKLTIPHADRWIVRTRAGYFAPSPEPEVR